jgi:putative ABC transport system permease protein
VNTSRWHLALRLLVRDWRAGEQRILVAALVIAVAATTAISFFTDRLANGMMNSSAEFLGADLALVSSRRVGEDWLDTARGQGLQLAETLEFASVVLHGEQLQLASIKAVDGDFPLRGSMRTADAVYAGDVATRGVPQPGEAWAAPRLMQALDLAIGDLIELGQTRLRVSRVLTFEPGQMRDVFGVAPRLLVNMADVPATGVIQPGSRLSWQYLFAGPSKAIGDYRSWVEGRLQAGQELLGVREGRRALGTALERAERFLGLAVLAAIVLAGVAVAMAVRRYTERHFDMSAMLRCLGATQRDIVVIFLLQLLLIGLLAGVTGSLLGWLAQWGLVVLLADLLPAASAPSGLWPLLPGLATGLIILAGFALPPLMRLREVPPLRVLRRDLAPLPARSWLVYGAAILAVVALMWRYTGNWPLTLAVLGGSIIAVITLALTGFALLATSRYLKGRVGAAWRFGLNNLWRNRQTSLSQVLAFGLTLMAMAMIALVRSDLLTTWQNQLPENAPNHFAVNILPHRVDAMQAFLDEHGVPASAIYPMVRGRLVNINAVAVREAVTKEEGNHNALNRELNLTWSAGLQGDNAIVDGLWWLPGDYGRALVSVESRLAERLGIRTGDMLGFTVGSEEITAEVASLRAVRWDSFRPNFYMVFPPGGALEKLPATYITSFYLPSGDKRLLVDMVREFPAVTVLELDLIMAEVGRIFRQVTLAVEYVLLFVLLAGFAVLFAALQNSLDERLYEGALLRALGASRRQLRAGHLAEYTALGAIAGLVAAMGTECLAWLLYSEVMHLEYSFKWQVWLAAPLVGALLVGCAGYWGTRPVLQQTPLSLLRDR